MVILNSLYCGISFEYFSRTFFDFTKGIGIFCRDVSVVFLSVTLFDFLLYCLLIKLRFLHNSIKLLFITVNICIFLADVFTVYYFKAPLNRTMLDAITMTNFRESTEFMRTFLEFKESWILFFCVGVLLYLLQRFLKVIHKRKLLFLILLLAGVFGGVLSEKRDGNVQRVINSVALPRLSWMLYTMHNENLAWQKIYQATLDNDIHFIKNDSDIPYVVFVLGESTGRNHMGIYGYNLPTTPNLAKLKEENMLYVFDDVISPHGVTGASMSKIFTFWRYGSKDHWFSYTSLLKILKKAGYNTIWLSNQEIKIGVNATCLFSKQCNSSIFVEEFRENFSNGIPYDEKILPLLDKSLEHEYDKNFYAIHLMGTHEYYRERYPIEYKRFEPEQEEGKTEAIRQIRAHYDNAIFYNDHIVSEIIRRFWDKNAVVIYISDHGEDVYDGGGYFTHFENTGDRYIHEIPMIIWVSSEFSKKYPELEYRIASSIHKPYMTDDIIHTVLDIMSIETEEYDPSRSIINPSFDASRMRINNKYIYNKESGFHELP